MWCPELFLFSKGGKYATAEAKAGKSFGDLTRYSRIMKQGNHEFNISRLQRYLRYGDGTHDQLVNHLLNEARSGQLKAFVGFYKWKRLYELPKGYPYLKNIKYILR